MEITVNIVDTLFDSIPKGTVVANYVTEVDTVNFKMYSTVYSIDETNKAIVTTKKVDANNLEAIHFDAINWVTTDKATIDNIYPKVVSKYQNKFKKEGVIYKITKDYDLNGCVLTIPDNCTLQFEGGTITNGSINLNYCNIDSTRNSIINNCILKGYLNKQTVYSDWFYLDSDDCTDTLSNIFKISKGCKLILNEGTYNVSVKNLVGSDYADPINISILQPQSDSHIIINGIINLISTNRTHYNIIGIVDKDNVIIEGSGQIIGDLQTHTGTTGEWGHGILVSGSRNVNVRDLKVSYCWGDGISISYAEKILTDKGLINSSYTPPKSINITNIKSSFNRRLGISIINGDGIILESSITEGNGTINGTSPKAGLDIEPNPNQSVNNVIVNGCLFYDNVVTYFPSDGLIEDKAISCIIQNSICKKQVTIGNVGKIIGCEIKYLLINGSRFINIQDNVITESLILAGDKIDGLNVIENTFLGLTTDGYDSCIRISCNNFSKVNIANNNFSLYTNSNMRKLVTYTKKQTNAIDIIDSVINYNKNLTLLFYPYANFYNCKFTFSGFNIYNITSELDKYPDSCSFVNCSFIANNSSFYIRDNIVDNYKIIIENCKYYTKQDNPTDFINFIGHTSSLNIISLNNTGKSILYLNDVDEENNRPVINNNYNGHRFYNTSKHRPEYYFNNDWFDSCGYNVNENRNSDGTLIDKLSIISDKSKILNSNKIYKIVSDIDLQGEELTLPANCTLDFQGGSFSNGTLVGSNTKIKAGIEKIFGDDIIISGSWNINESYPDWFGVDKTGSTNNSISFSNSILLSNTIKINNGKYLLDGLDISKPVNIIGEGAINTTLILANPIEVHDCNGTSISKLTIEIADNIESLDYLMKIYKAFHLTIESCTFYGKDKVNKGLYSYGDVQSYYHYINNNRFVNLVNGVYLSYNSNAATVSNNEFYLCTNCVLIDSSNGCRIENNTFQNYVTTAIFLDYNDYGSNTWGNIIQGNYFEGTPATATADIDFNNKTQCRNNTILGNKSTYITLPHKHILNCITENTIIETTNSTYRYPTKLPGFVKLQNFDEASLASFATSEFTGVIAPRVLESGAIDLRVYVKNADGTYTWKSIILSSNTNGNQINISVLNATEITQYAGGYLQLGYDANIGAKRLTVENNTGKIKYSADGNNWRYLQETGIGTTANRPTGVNAGFQYFDTSLSKYICWNGTTWTNLDGTALN